MTVAARDAQTLDVFATDGSGAVQTAGHVEGGRPSPWRAWSPLARGHAAPGAAVAVVSRAAGTLDVFTVGTDGHVYTSGWWPGSSAWRPWARIGTLTVPASTPVHAISRGAQTMEVFVTDGAGVVRTAFWSGGGGWRPWQQLHGGRAAAGAAVTGVSRAPGAGDAFVLGTDRYVYTSSHGPGGTDIWGPWSRIGSLQLPAGAAVHAASRTPDSIDVAATDAAGVVQVATWHAGCLAGLVALVGGAGEPGDGRGAGDPGRSRRWARRLRRLVRRARGDRPVAAGQPGHVEPVDEDLPAERRPRESRSRPSPVPPTSLDVVFAAVDGSVNAARWAADVADGHWRG